MGHEEHAAGKLGKSQLPQKAAAPTRSRHSPRAPALELRSRDLLAAIGLQSIARKVVHLGEEHLLPGGRLALDGSSRVHEVGELDELLGPRSKMFSGSASCFSASSTLSLPPASSIDLGGPAAVGVDQVGRLPERVDHGFECLGVLRHGTCSSTKPKGTTPAHPSRRRSSAPCACPSRGRGIETAAPGTMP